MRRAAHGSVEEAREVVYSSVVGAHGSIARARTVVLLGWWLDR
jgi:hypothetical protein